MMEASRGLEDYIPVIVAVTVDFFSALFVSVCISSSGSILLSALLIAVDLGQIMLEFREVKDNSKTVLALWQDLQVSTQDNKTSLPGNSDSTYLLTRILAVTRNPAAFDIVSLKPLVEYVECVIPLVFAINKLILEELPNVVYYPGGAGKWVMAALANVFVYATLEICSLLLLNHFLQRNFSFSPLYQLAFALESSRNFVQGTLFLEIVGLLQYELMHLDADFTFRFEWLRENNGS
ncbi:hypothetical protein PF008_g12890 [Phytophthora fragariae]|uniref:Uncharacterized protein n=1 Tax=Phytophthora fragariae TaxID=53985 RepID=A0A6G0RLN7_9STRA|nr:hypothetical protein PF008_g12890 [Phytophthora fragariae]